MPREKSQVAKTARTRVPMRSTGTEQLVELPSVVWLLLGLLDNGLAPFSLLGPLHPKPRYPKHRSLIVAIGDFASQIEEVLRELTIVLRGHEAPPHPAKHMVGRKGSKMRTGFKERFGGEWFE